MNLQLKLRKIENGWIVVNDLADGTGNYGKENYFPSLDDAFSFIRSQEKEVSQ